LQTGGGGGGPGGGALQTLVSSETQVSFGLQPEAPQSSETGRQAVFESMWHSAPTISVPVMSLME